MKIRQVLFAAFLLVAAVSQAQLSISVSNIITSSCPNTCNAQAQASVTGGIPPYDIYWSSGEAGVNATALCAGTNRYAYVTDGNGDFEIVYFNITPPTPTFTVSVTPAETMPVCQNSTVHLTASGADSYSWYYTGSGYTAPTQSVTAYSATTQITVYGYNAASGCTQSLTYTITTNPAPTMTVSNPNYYVCAGDSNRVSISGTSDYYTWSDNVTRPNTFYITSGNFYAQVTGHSTSNGCSTQPYGVSANVLPPVVLNTGTTDVCAGGAGYVYANGAINSNSYVWSFGGTGSYYPNIHPTHDTTFWVYGIGPNNCHSDTSFLTMHVNPLPNVSVSSAGLHACGDVYLDMYAAGNADFYSWDNGDTGDTIHRLFYQSPQLVTLTGRINATGCLNTDTMTITWDPMPYYVGITDHQNTHCASDTVVNLSAYNGWDSYTWQPGGYTGTNPSIVPTGTTTYSVTGTMNSGCSRTGSIQIVVNPLPVMVASSSADSVCTGNSVSLNVSGVDYYTWDEGSNPTVDSTTTWHVSGGVFSTGCSTTDSITIVAVPHPVVIISASDTVICQGENLTLNASGATTYYWDYPLYTGGTTQNLTPTYSYTYTVYGTDTHGCQGTATIAIPVNASPSVSSQASIYAFCAGGSTTLYGYGADSYVWNNGDTGSVVTQQVDTTGNLYVVGTTNGCSDTSFIGITAYPLPVITVTPSNDTICQYDMLTLYGTGAGAYEWLGVGNNLIYQGSWQYQILNDQSFTVRGTDYITGCYSLPVTVNITAQLLTTTMQLQPDMLCENASPVTLSSNLPAGGWYGGNGVNDPLFDPSLAGPGTQYIYYHYTSSLGCNITATDSIVVDACVGLAALNPTQGWNLYPNPTNGTLTITSPQHQGEVSISIYNTTGQLIRSEKYSSFESGSLDLSALENGAYLVRISIDNNSTNYRVVKMN